MALTNFDLAPPARTVDGLLAVPIDIQHIDASLTFDGAASSGSGDATLSFVVGPQAGNPIFDLRQTITGAWLDGVAIPTAKVAHHDFGGGPNAELRVLESVLAAGSAHTIRVTYTLGPPQASTAGSYQPAMVWSAGPRLAFNFGFTDLGAGRYLEAWVPANLIFDQFSMTLELRVLNTAVAHGVIANGVVTAVGANHWTVAFPDRFTALSSLLELRALDTLASLTDSVILPVSGVTVSVTAWKLATNPVDLGAQVANLKSWLAANESSTGPYLHDDRFVAFVNVGGMEYDGGTTSGPGSLRHETFHSWYGRGVKPASQADGWWDEAWTVYNDLGAVSSLPFNFGDPPVELSSRNPWVRVTPSSAYSSGERFFEGVASLVGVANLRAHMGAFYVSHRRRPATTAEMEAFLVCRSGEPRLVHAYHRFAYGFADPSPVPDLWLKDDPGDPGGNAWAGRFWDSPDLWIRNADDGGTVHQPVEHGQDNWFHARVRNRSTSGTARHFLVTFNVKPFAGVEFTYPGDFLPCIAAAPGFELGPGQSAIVKARWPRALIPPAGTHACWLAAVLSRSDEPTAGFHVWEHNNLAQKNLTVVDLAPDQRFILPFVVNRFTTRRRLTFELVRPAHRETIEAEIAVRAPTPRDRPGGFLDELPATTGQALDCGDGMEHDHAVDAADETGATSTLARLARGFEAMPALAFKPGRASRLPVRLAGAGQMVVGLRIHAPRTARVGDVFTLDLLVRDDAGDRVVGGLAVEVHIAKEG